MTHEGQMSFWPDAVPPPPPPKTKRRNPRGRGEQLRDDGCERVLANEPDETFQQQGVRIAQELAGLDEDFTVIEIRDRSRIQPRHPNAWGALMARIHRLGILRIVGHKRHVFDSCHCRVIPIYRGIKKQEPTPWRN